MMPEPTRNIQMSGTEYADIFQKKQDDFNRYIQEMEVPINRLDLYLAGAGIAKDEKGDEIVKKLDGVQERMNMHGREFIKSRLRTFLSPNTYMSAIDDKDINRLYEVEIEALQDDLYPRMNEFECSLNDISSIYDMICSIVYLALKKARGDKQAIYQGMSSSNSPTNQQPPSGGIFNIPQGWTR